MHKKWFLRWFSQQSNHFRLAQLAIKFVSRMISLFCKIVLKLVAIFPSTEHVQKLVTRWLRMRENWLLVG